VKRPSTVSHGSQFKNDYMIKNVERYGEELKSKKQKMASTINNALKTLLAVG
jgi:hypothetical protein